MDDKTTYQIQYWTAWSGPVFIATYFYFWVYLGHNFPPPSTGYSGQELVANYYAKYRSDILLGMSVTTFFGFMYMVWSVLMTCQMLRREKVPVLSLLQLTGGVLTAWLLGGCPAMLAWCARYAGTPGVDPELIKSVHLVSWYIFDMCYVVASIQMVGCGVFAILDKKKPTLYPAWIGWLALLSAASFFPLTFFPYVDEGAFAGDGWWSFYVIFGSWGAFIVSYTYYMFQDIKRIRTSPALAVGQAVSQGRME